MSKVQMLMEKIPTKLGIPEGATKRMAKAFDLLYVYDATSKGMEFQRIGNTMEECEERLDTVFAMIDGAVQKYKGDTTAAKEAKRLLLLCSTPVQEEQIKINTRYSTPTAVYNEIMSTDEAISVGSQGWWNG